MIEELDKAYKILETIAPDTDSQGLYDIADSAFRTSSLCMEAAVLLMRSMEYEDAKEDFLFNAVRDAEFDISEKNIEDIDVLRSLMYGYKELARLYLNYGRMRQARRFFERVVSDKRDIFNVHNELLAVYVYFEDYDKVDELFDAYQEKMDAEMLLIYLVYLYKKCAYKGFVHFSGIMHELCPELLRVIEGEEISLPFLRKNAFLVDTCPHFLSLYKEVITR